jgi:hypothetical protein
MARAEHNSLRVDFYELDVERQEGRKARSVSPAGSVADRSELAAFASELGQRFTLGSVNRLGHPTALVAA